MKALVTGGTGYVGGAILRALRKRNIPVRVFARKASRVEHLKPMGVEFAYGDLSDRQSIEKALVGCDVLFHAAALYDLWGLSEKELMEADREGTRNVLEAALLAGTGKVVYTSTAVIIGERKGEVGMESTVHRGYFLSTYEHAKYEAEQVALSYAEKGLPITIINPAGVYGPGDLKPTGRAVIDFINGRMPGMLSGVTSIVYIEDVGEAHALAMEKGKDGQRYIACGNVITMREWAELLSRLTGARIPPTTPNFVSNIFATFSEMLSSVTKRPPVLSKETFRLIDHGFKVDGSRAANELDLEYTPLEKGMTEAIKWYWEQGLLKRKPACLAEDVAN